MSARRISIVTSNIALSALLKWAGVVATGGEAKQLVQTGRVQVNGVVERRRGRQLHPGDRVTCPDGTVLEIAGAGSPPPSLVP